MSKVADPGMEASSHHCQFSAFSIRPQFSPKCGGRGPVLLELLPSVPLAISVPGNRTNCATCRDQLCPLAGSVGVAQGSLGWAHHFGNYSHTSEHFTFQRNCYFVWKRMAGSIPKPIKILSVWWGIDRQILSLCVCVYKYM